MTLRWRKAIPSDRALPYASNYFSSRLTCFLIVRQTTHPRRGPCISLRKCTLRSAFSPSTDQASAVQYDFRRAQLLPPTRHLQSEKIPFLLTLRDNQPPTRHLQSEKIRFQQVCSAYLHGSFSKRMRHWRYTQKGMKHD